jgi:hypothetical protein
VGGYSDVADGSTHGFIYDVRRRAMRDIGEGYPSAINDFGVAVDESVSGEAALFWGVRVIPVESLSAEIESFASSVNNEGIAVGVALLLVIPTPGGLGVNRSNDLGSPSRASGHA